jgi:hypothetical protein
MSGSRQRQKPGSALATPTWGPTVRDLDQVANIVRSPHIAQAAIGGATVLACRRSWSHPPDRPPHESRSSLISIKVDRDEIVFLARSFFTKEPA